MSTNAQTRKEARDAAQRESWRDAQRALEVCRSIRDDESATAEDRLKAVELLLALKKD